jgi:hypothetical protein
MCGYKNKLEDRDTKKTKCNNHEIKEVKNFNYLGSKKVTNGSVKREKLHKELKMQENFTI